MKFEHYIVKSMLDEAAYEGNLGFQELVKFYQEADNTEIDKMERIIKNDDWDGFKDLIKRVLGVKLK